jgi:hypothetical protein
MLPLKFLNLFNDGQSTLAYNLNAGSRDQAQTAYSLVKLMTLRRDLIFRT